MHSATYPRIRMTKAKRASAGTFQFNLTTFSLKVFDLVLLGSLQIFAFTQGQGGDQFQLPEKFFRLARLFSRQFCLPLSICIFIDIESNNFFFVCVSKVATSFVCVGENRESFFVGYTVDRIDLYGQKIRHAASVHKAELHSSYSHHKLTRNIALLLFSHSQRVCSAGKQATRKKFRC